MAEPGHTYTNEKGEVVPSVTQIVSIINKKGIPEWANMLGYRKESYKSVLNTKAIIGTLTHEKIHCDLVGEKYVTTEYYQEERESMYLFMKYLEWKDKVEPNALWSEKTLVCDTFGGTIDFVGSLKQSNNELLLIDFKTSKRAYSTHFLQLGGYLELIDKLYPEVLEKIKMCMILNINIGEVHMKPISIEQMSCYRESFKKALELYKIWDYVLKTQWGDSVV